MSGTEPVRRGRRTLPVNILLKGRVCLLVGAGHVARRKCESRFSHGARVILVAPRSVPGLDRLAARGEVSLREEPYDDALLDELRPFLVYTATDDDAVNRRVAADCAERRILCSSASSWETGDFISPSILR